MQFPKFEWIRFQVYPDFRYFLGHFFLDQKTSRNFKCFLFFSFSFWCLQKWFFFFVYKTQTQKTYVRFRFEDDIFRETKNVHKTKPMLFRYCSRGRSTFSGCDSSEFSRRKSYSWSSRPHSVSASSIPDSKMKPRFSRVSSEAKIRTRFVLPE